MLCDEESNAAVRLCAYLGGMYNLLAYVHFPEALKHGQQGNVQPLPRDLIIASSMVPTAW